MQKFLIFAALSMFSFSASALAADANAKTAAVSTSSGNVYFYNTLANQGITITYAPCSPDANLGRYVCNLDQKTTLHLDPLSHETQNITGDASISVISATSDDGKKANYVGPNGEDFPSGCQVSLYGNIVEFSEVKDTTLLPCQSAIGQ